MTLVKPAPDAQVREEKQNKRTWPFPHPRHGKRWLILGVIALLFLAFAGKFLLGQGPAAAAITYTEEMVATRTITNSLTGSGTLQPANSYTVTTLIEGEVLSASFEEGDMVEQGTVLYKIDSDDAAANIEKAQISLSQAQRNYESTAENRTVKANSSGTLYTLDVKEGDEVSQGQTVATIHNDSTMTLTVPFPAEDAATFYVGQAAQVTLDGTFETLNGTVRSISGSKVVGTGNTVTREVTDDQEKDKVRQSAVKISYKNLQKEREEDQGQVMRLYGPVTQISSSGSHTYIRMSYNKDADGKWYNDVIVIAEEDTGVKEGDMLTAVVTVDGVYQEQDASGKEIIVPRFELLFVDKIE